MLLTMVVAGKRVGTPTEKDSKVDLSDYAGFKCALEDLYRHLTQIYSFKFCAENRIWIGTTGAVVTAFSNCSPFALAMK